MTVTIGGEAVGEILLPAAETILVDMQRGRSTCSTSTEGFWRGFQRWSLMA